jgi:hypothetical protein
LISVAKDKNYPVALKAAEYDKVMTPSSDARAELAGISTTAEAIAAAHSALAAGQKETFSELAQDAFNRAKNAYDIFNKAKR